MDTWVLVHRQLVQPLLEGYSGARVNIIDYITIATTSNAIDFGDLITVRTYVAGFSDSTRAIVGGGNDGSTNLNSIEVF